ncbi:uncharacterized protein LOC124276041 [Haliotis rubra]|uniref:uncharacterized protein LOC124276041 n=1 Tax=Haliotis rubra TaxID=36100 RepID=UPI001EE585D8|nr:uncharacterized protein LOC124276041 [Haliotis rubra]
MKKYSESLDKKAFTRYKEKICVIGGEDPYQIDTSEWSKDHDSFPEVSYPDLTLKEDKPVCLAVKKEYSADYVPTSLQAKYPKVLSELRDDKCEGMSRDELVEHCGTLLPSIAFTEEEAINVEAATRQQADYYCDFVVWTPKDIFLQRIEPNSEVWNKLLDRSSRCFATVILPELVGKLYRLSEEETISSAGKKSTKKKPLRQPESTNRKATKQKPATKEKTSKSKATTAAVSKSSKPSPGLDASEENLELFCVCDGAKGGIMIGCDSEDCPNKPFEWFHLSCVNLKAEPEGDWFCPDCLERNFLRSIKRK